MTEPVRNVSDTVLWVAIYRLSTIAQVHGTQPLDAQPQQSNAPMQFFASCAARGSSNCFRNCNRRPDWKQADGCRVSYCSKLVDPDRRAQVRSYKKPAQS